MKTDNEMNSQALMWNTTYNVSAPSSSRSRLKQVSRAHRSHSVINIIVIFTNVSRNTVWFDPDTLAYYTKVQNSIALENRY